MSKNLVREALELFEDDDNSKSSKSKQKRFLRYLNL